MASLTMTVSFVAPCGSGVVSRRPSVGQRRPSLIVAKAALEQAAPAAAHDADESSGRRSVMFAAAAAAVCAVAQMGMAAEAVEPKRGTAEAKKQYAPVCVTMPTAKICHK